MPTKDCSLTLSFLESSSLEKGLQAYVRQKASRGDYQGAIALLDYLISCYPQKAADYNNRGLMYFYQEQFFLALGDYNEAIAIDANLDGAYHNRGNCYAALGDWASALADYELALDLNPGNLRALISQAITFRQLGLYDLALENLDIALIIGRTLQLRIYGERGRTYHLRGDWNCAIADYHRVLETFPDTLQDSQYQEKVSRWLEQLLHH